MEDKIFFLIVILKKLGLIEEFVEIRYSCYWKKIILYDFCKAPVGLLTAVQICFIFCSSLFHFK